MYTVLDALFSVSYMYVKANTRHCSLNLKFSYWYIVIMLIIIIITIIITVIIIIIIITVIIIMLTRPVTSKMTFIAIIIIFINYIIKKLDFFQTIINY